MHLKCCLQNGSYFVKGEMSYVSMGLFRKQRLAGSGHETAAVLLPGFAIYW